ncbi:MAG: tripartite tricarboxylate transporter substrate binding protein [Hyphomicrobiaceae bacterium]
MKRQFAVGLGAVGLVVATLLAGAGAVLAQTYPSKPIRFIVPFPPGGTLDQIARRVQPGMQKELGQSILIDNKGGASGSIGTALAAQSAPDGYTILMVFDTHAVNPTLIQGLAFDTVKDFAPIMKIGWAPMLIATHTSTPYTSLADLIAAAKAKPGSVPYGTVGQGSLAHLAMSQMANDLKLTWTHVPYKGGGPLTNDAVAGHVPVAISSVASIGPHVKAGKLRGLALTSDKRHPQFPDVPTVSEAGLPGFSANAWWGLVAPAKTPPDIIKRLNEAFKKVFEEPDVKQSLVEQAGIVYELSTPEAFGTFVETEIARWAKVVKDNRIAPE